MVRVEAKQVTEVFLDNGRTKITDKQIMHGTTTIPLDMISEVTALKRVLGIRDFAGAAVLLVFGLYAISFGEPNTTFIGVVILAGTAYYVYRIIKKKEFSLRVDLFNDKTYTLTTENANAVDEIYEALQQARMSR